MQNQSTSSFRTAQAVVAGDVAEGDSLTARAGNAAFAVGRSGDAANPYELLSASLAACTAMTIRQYAKRKSYPLTHVEVSVSYRHDVDGSQPSFNRSIVMQGELSDEQRAKLMQAASLCPVGKTLGLGARIDTQANDESPTMSAATPANYADDLDNFSIVNIDPD